jgi:hypothetical protein
MARDGAALESVEVKQIRPTQITLGFREVEEKRQQWRQHTGDDRAKFLSRHTVPAVLGPKGRHYIIDHHHLVRALYDEGVKEIPISLVDDLSELSKTSFWIYLDNRSWCHLYDREGKRRGFDDVPSSIKDMTDDPFRGLAGELRRAGGFAKDTAPLNEFLWADFLRQRIDAKTLATNFADMLIKAIEFAKSKDARYLPGWCGPDPII